MDKELLELIKTLSGEGASTLRLYVIAYFAYWSLAALAISGTILGVAGLAYRLVKRFQDHEWAR